MGGHYGAKMNGQQTLNMAPKGPNLLMQRRGGPILGSIKSNKTYGSNRSHKDQKTKSVSRAYIVSSDEEEEDARPKKMSKVDAISVDDEDDDDIEVLKDTNSDVSEDEQERKVKTFKRSRKDGTTDLFGGFKSNAVKKVKTDKNGKIEDKYKLPKDDFGQKIKQRKLPIAMPFSKSTIGKKKKDEDEGLDAFMTEEERKLMKGNKSLMDKLNQKPNLGDPQFNSLQKPGTSIPKKLEKEKQLKKSLTEEESKTENASNKFSKLVQGLSSTGSNEDFAKKLIKNKVVKRQEEEQERNILEIDLDEEIDSGLRNNFEEFDEEKNFRKQRKIVEKKYDGKIYPGALNKQELEAKAQKHLKCVPKILSGQIESPYYGHASDIAKNSASTVLSSSEFLRLPIGEFTIGFYGAKRQAVIASLIKNTFEDELNKALLTNRTMKFWSKDSFVLYVLACDVAVRMAASDLDISTGEAFDVLFDTVDYGKYITDPVPV
ncbi:hypothetical protein WICANDRAFT_69714 [Wickerhamomyces anomalus NRRL Y-366-8]|uniref:Restriction of telomere capping protein 4 n=1 Tax=Wickerhamomyces anomalus (strain ATCC 58044 / CBS 1984 / NCYC 433 / NRRL Y-366-8) TaxID=683960 RepID=A0A1E3P387_WICAA|nr:uncharacterized protein WICANDRAFT_69714 [Wickerhamomyces anomalus NRRL Y-366-8]ODQ59362.1 hypothetical protein WICANDRAFT_69714 [Wickerhamomyces anomalus NRRL Y-366-8]